jgi:succinate-semialdehyde dehydrogenase/glutarate-semialdehyde dehydrogenase
MSVRTLAVRNPRTGEADHRIAPLDAAAVRALAGRLRARQPAWEALGAEGRCAALRRLRAEVEARAGALERALIADTGRTRISRIEVAGFLGQLDRWAAQAPALLELPPPRRSATPGIRIEAAARPYALVGCIAPWNFPLTLAMIDAVPALAAGCAVIVKPSEVTPRFIGPLGEALAAVPDIPCALIEGDGATGAALVEAVDFVAFTGSVATGRKVAVAAAGRLIPASLELGGKDPMLILASADPAWAARVALRASVVNTGQACQSIERLHVARPIHDAFLDALVAAAQATRLSFPDAAQGDIGPFIFEKQAAIVQAQIDDALARGARLLCGGRVEALGGGLWLRPTVLADVTFDMAVMQHETFGPVLPVMAFDTLEEGIAQANHGSYGLSAAVLAGSEAEALAVAPRLNAGAVSVQDGALTSMVWDAEKTSFGESGVGPSRMGASGLTRFLRRQAILVQEGAALPLGAYAEDAR